MARELRLEVRALEDKTGPSRLTSLDIQLAEKVW